MKKLIFTLLLLCLALPALAETDLAILLTDARLQAAPYYTNRTIWVQAMSVPNATSPSVVLGATIIGGTDTNGLYVVTNAQPYLYLITVKSSPYGGQQEQFKVLVTATNLGTIYAADNLVAMDTATFPAGSVAWAAAVTDSRYARGSNAPVSFYNVTNALGYIPQPSSQNLSNWSTLSTNLLAGSAVLVAGSGITVTTNGPQNWTVSQYAPPVISSFTNNQNVVEIGATVSSTLLGWTLSGAAITSQSLNQGIGSLATNIRGYNDTAVYTTTRTYTLTVSDGVTSPTANTSVTFESKMYYGGAATTSPTDVQLQGMSQFFATSRVQTLNGITLNAQYMIIAYPASMGAATFTINGLPNTDFTLTTRVVQNASGGLVSYNIYNSNNLLTGTYNVSVN